MFVNAAFAAFPAEPARVGNGPTSFFSDVNAAAVQHVESQLYCRRPILARRRRASWKLDAAAA